MTARCGFLFLLLMNATSAQAGQITQKECGSYNLAANFNMVHNQTPWRLEWCWAITCADLLSYKLGRTGSRAIAPIDTAVSTLTADPAAVSKSRGWTRDFQSDREARAFGAFGVRNRKIFQGTQATYRTNSPGYCLLAYPLKGGACAQSKLNSNDFQIEPLSGEKTAANKSGSGPRNKSHDIVKNKSAAPRTVASNEFTTDQIDQQTPWLNHFDDLNHRINEDELKELGQKVDAACGTREPIPRYMSDAAEFKAGPQSPAVSILKSALKDKDAYILAIHDHFINPSTNAENDGHAVMLIGARWNLRKTTCEFEIRNSWGPQCSQYPAPYNTKAHCEAGNLWISEQTLAENMMGAYSLDLGRAPVGDSR